MKNLCLRLPVEEYFTFADKVLHFFDILVIESDKISMSLSKKQIFLRKSK